MEDLASIICLSQNEKFYKVAPNPLGKKIKILNLTAKWLLFINSFLPDCKHLFPGFFTFFHAISKFLIPEHDCYAKFTSCSTKRNIKITLEK